jgi:hypothetical protein
MSSTDSFAPVIVPKSIEHLPIELLEMVFENLKLFDLWECRHVCKDWREVIDCRKYWKCAGLC